MRRMAETFRVGVVWECSVSIEKSYLQCFNRKFNFGGDSCSSQYTRKTCSKVEKIFFFHFDKRSRLWYMTQQSSMGPVFSYHVNPRTSAALPKASPGTATLIQHINPNLCFGYCCRVNVNRCCCFFLYFLRRQLRLFCFVVVVFFNANYQLEPDLNS